MITAVLITYRRKDKFEKTIACLQASPLITQIVVANNNGFPIACPSGVEVIDMIGNDQSLARNAALNKAAQEWVLFLDDDVEFKPESVDMLLQLAVTHNANILGASVVTDGKIMDGPSEVQDSKLDFFANGFNENILSLVSKTKPLIPCDTLGLGFTLIRRSVALKGLFDPAMNLLCEDTDYILELKKYDQPYWTPSIVIQHFPERLEAEADNVYLYSRHRHKQVLHAQLAFWNKWRVVIPSRMKDGDFIPDPKRLSELPSCFEATVEGERFLFTDPSKLYSHAYSEQEGYEPGLESLLKKVLSEGGVFCDIGSHLGWYGVLASRWADSVIMVEPNPQNAIIAERNLVLNQVTNAAIISEALSDSTENYRLTDSSICDEKIYVEKGDGASLTTTLDALNIQPDVIKIDTHGSELSILKGGQKTLSKCRHVFMESHTQMSEIAYTGLQIAELLKGFDLKVVKDHRKRQFEIVDFTGSLEPDDLLWGINEHC